MGLIIAFVLIIILFFLHYWEKSTHWMEYNYYKQITDQLWNRVTEIEKEIVRKSKTKKKK